MMLEMPGKLILYGFSFAVNLSKINIKELHRSLSYRKIALSDVVLSAWEDLDSDCTWVIAANRYLDENEIRNMIEFILENNIEEKYLLTSFTTP